jgi:hypothetical protein
MQKPGGKYLSLALALTAYAVMVGVLLRESLAGTQGKIVYALDDAYIHMAVAKNLALHHVWGISPDGFTACNSALGWPLLLAAAYAVFGVRDAIPLLLNLVFGALLVWFAWRVLRRHISSSFWLSVGVLAAVFLTPIAPLLFAGMEHTLHLLATAAFVFTAADVLSEGDGASVDGPAGKDAGHGGLARMLLPLLAMLTVLARYEGLFVVGVVFLLLLVRRRLLDAVLVLAGGLLPVTVFGLYAHAQGWGYLPNSLLLKAPPSSFTSLHGLRIMLERLQVVLVNTPQLLHPALALLLLAWVLARRRPFWGRMQAAILICVGALVMHATFASVGYFYRYEAYLVGLSVLVFCAGLAGALPEAARLGSRWRSAVTAGIVAAVVILGWPLGVRAVRAFREAPVAPRNIFEQQYQMGLFLAQNYPSATVCLNDIGAVSYLSDVHVVDLVGLASVEVLVMKYSQTYSIPAIERLGEIHGARLAIVYDRWFWPVLPLQPPPSWRMVGQWQIQNNVACGNDTVSFYSIGGEEEEQLKSNLRRYSARLPAGVRVSF